MTSRRSFPIRSKPGVKCASRLTGTIWKEDASVDAFLNAAIGWESFLSDWHIAAINRDSSAFVSDLQGRVEDSVTGRWSGLAGRIALSIPKSQPRSRSPTPRSKAGISLSGSVRSRREREGKELCDPYRGRVLALPQADHDLIGAVVGIRDCIAHRSQKASDTMNAALSSLRPADAALRRTAARVAPSGIGAYLYASTSGGRRVELYHARLEVIAEKLRVV